MRSASPRATSSSSERGCRHQTRRSSDEIHYDRKPSAPTDDDSDDHPDASAESARLKVTYMRRRHGEREPRNRPTGDIRPLQPTLQQPRRGYSQIEWSEPEAMSTALPPRPTYVPLIPEDREEFERQNWMYIHNGRWGDWPGQYGMIHTFIPDVEESQSDIANDATVYKAPLDRSREPHESDEKQSESADDEPYKEP